MEAPNEVSIVGVGYSEPESFVDCREATQTKMELAFSAVKSALEHAGLDPHDLDASVFATVDGFEGTNRVDRTLEVFGQSANIPVISINTGGTASGSAVKAAYEFVASGKYDTVLVYGSPSFDTAVEAQQILNTAAPPLFEKPFIAAAHMGAFYGSAYMEEYGATDEDYALAAAKNYEGAALNPWAHRRDNYSVEDVLESPMVVSPLRVLGTCPNSSGASALVMTSAETARTLTDTPVRIRGITTSTNTFLTGYRTYESFPKLRNLAEWLYPRTGIDDPREQIDVAELFNPYIPFEPMQYEALKFCEPGEGIQLLRSGATSIDGDLPVNPSGGVVATNSGICASLTRHCEIALQLMGEAGDRQVDSPRLGIAHSWGGNDGQFNSLAILARD